MKQPSLYLPHGGGPCFFMDWTMGPADTWHRMADWLRALPASLPERPRALLVVSAHWEQRVPTVLASASPPLLYDYYGFPPHTYQLQWPAPGAPELAGQVQELLQNAGIATAQERERGYDHGVFVPLKVAFPEADVPTLQLSLRADLDPAAHLAIGRALRPLREQGVLILGSGMSYHNMRGFMSARGAEDAKAFDAWLSAAVSLPQRERDAALCSWASAPGGRASHPREEHLLPLMVAAGAGSDAPGEVVFRDVVLGTTVSAVRFD